MKEGKTKDYTAAANKPYDSTGPLVSVIVPVYNVEQYLRECLDSVIGQTYSNLEIIVVDDGSTDSSGTICDEYKANDPRMRVIHKKNGGLGNARNVGMDAAQGKYIIFLDSDDYWDLNAVQVLCETAEKDILQVLVFSAESFWDGVKRPEKFSDYLHSVQNGFVRSGPDSLRIAMDNHEYYASANLRFYLLSYIRQQGFRFDEGIIHEDESFSFLAYLFANRVECIGEQFYKRRYRPSSIMNVRTQLNSAQGYAGALNTMLSYYRERNLSEQGRDSLIRYMKSFIHWFCETYRKALQEEKNNRDWSFRISRAVARETKAVRKKARILNPFLSRTYRISTYSLFSWYCVSGILARIK